MLGASWASYRALAAELERVTGQRCPSGRRSTTWPRCSRRSRPLDLATATDGNHGRAVARFAHLVGLGARIFVPGRDDRRPHRRHPSAKGASCEVVDGTYDDAVARAAPRRATSRATAS